MAPRPHRPRGRAVPAPPPLPPLPEAIEDDPLGAFGHIALRFSPPLALADFRRFAAAHALAPAPTPDQPYLFRAPEGLEVAYGLSRITPLPSSVDILWLDGGADGPRAPAVLALAEAMLAAWPRARWEACWGFTAHLARRFSSRAVRHQLRRR